MRAPDFDVIVVGSGAGGGLAAWSFARRGKKVLILDRGRAYPAGWTGRDVLRNHRYGPYGQNTGPDIGVARRVFESPNGAETVVEPFQGGYNNNAMAVGGGTRVYGAQAWRFHPWDFEMASRYGVPSGSSLSDWPIGYEDLAPFYEMVEHEIGVCGGQPASNMPARSDYPMPPFPLADRGVRLRGVAEEQGWAHQAVPLLINSEARNGRAACIRCQFCVGFGCPSDAKAGTQNTVIPQILAQPGCALWSEARVLRLATDPSGAVVGVEAMVEGRMQEIRSEVVVLAAGAIESARLLLLSRTAREPEGVGNGHDLVGRSLQGHYYPGAQGIFSEKVLNLNGPGPSIATTEFNHDNEGIVGGGMLADDFLVLPPSFARDRRKPGVPQFGQELKDWVRSGYRQSFHICGPVQEIPDPNCRVTVDGRVVDDLGLPVARLSGTTHFETVRTSLFMRERAAEWLTKSGAQEVWKFPVTESLSAGQHQAGTCRMGVSPETGVVNGQGVVFGHENLLVCDGSVHVTNGGFNPVLTIMATSLRSAELFQF